MIVILKDYFQSNGFIQGVRSSCQHGIAYYLKFILSVERCRNHMGGLLSLAYILNIAVFEMIHIVAKHKTSTRKDYAK